MIKKNELLDTFLESMYDMPESDFVDFVVTYSERNHKSYYNLILEQIFSEIDTILENQYNLFIFGSSPYNVEEKEAIIDYSDCIYNDISDLKNKYFVKGFISSDEE